MLDFLYELHYDALIHESQGLLIANRMGLSYDISVSVMTVDTKLSLYPLTSTVTLLYCTETCNIKKRDVQKFEAAEMRILTSLLQFTILDLQSKYNIRKSLKVTKSVDFK